ncbi:MAG: ribosome silencing factor [Clostridiaceae bacterium]|nr:ribosome silencing factor [Clostridiaceae bacterium]
MEKSQNILTTAVKVLSDKKAKDIKVIDISKLTAIASYFVIASGTSALHVKSLADNVEEKLSETEVYPLKIEGYNSARWILMDYNDIVIHIFHEEDRAYYDLERLWQDGQEVYIDVEEN